MTVLTDRVAGWVGDALAAYRAGRPLALLFDYDGTLTPIVRHPSLARLPAANRDRLARLAALPDVAVGVISGRALAEVRAFVGLPGLLYAGSGGLELLLGGKRIEYPGAAAFRRVLDAVADDLAPVLARFPGTWVERKPVALAVHYRGLAPAAAVRFRTETSAALNRHPATQHREVSSSLEVTPAGGWDKGTAVELILDRVGPDVLPVYAGDAANDAEAMAVAALAGGVAIGIGPDAPPTATHRIATAAVLEGWLDRLARDLPTARGLRSPIPRTARPPMMTAPEPTAVVSAVPEPADGPGILIVGPDPAAREETAAAFRGLGWRVWAADPDDAAGTLADHPADILAAVVDLGRVSPDLVRCGVAAEVATYATTAFRRLSSVTLLPKPLDAASASATLRWLVGADDSPEPPA